MKKIALYSMLILASCNANKETGTSTTEEIKTDTIVNGGNFATITETFSPGCYRMIIGKDSAMMNLSVSGSNVSGKLDYKRFEKDTNTGNFAGTIDSNKITAWYTFQSEGMVSVRQVVFKINGNTLSEGYGNIVLKGDTAYFKFPNTLNYEANHPFTKVDCK